MVDALAEEPGSLVVLDDPQWADGATLRLLDRVAAEIRRLPLLVVGTHRDASELRAHRATEVLGLGPLSPSQAATMLSTAVDGADSADSAAVRHAAELSGGSPLYLRTLAKVAADALRGRVGLDSSAGAAPELRHLVAAAMRAAGRPAASAVEALSGSDTEADVARLLGVDSSSAATELLLPAVPAGLVDPRGVIGSGSPTGWSDTRPMPRCRRRGGSPGTARLPSCSTSPGRSISAASSGRAQVAAQLACTLLERGADEDAAGWPERALRLATASGDPNAIRARASLVWRNWHDPERSTSAGGRSSSPNRPAGHLRV